MQGGYLEGGIFRVGGVGDSQRLPDMHFASKLPLVDGVPLGFVKDAELDPIRTRGYTCTTTKAIRETIIARVLEGEIDPKKLPDSRLRVKYCVDKAGHNKVWIKVIDRQYITPNFVTKVLPHDLQVICRLTPHPNIALPYDSFQSHTSVYLVSEHTPGVDAVTYMAQHEHREHEARNVFSQVLAAFSYAHSQDVIHRDLKPANVVVDKDGHVKILDMGLSPKLSVVQGQQLHEATKRAYMSPEVIKSRRYESKEADVYSLGVLLYDMLHGCTPYTGQKDDMLQQIRLRAIKFYPRVSKDAKKLIKSMLHPDPWRRPTIDQLVADPWTRGLQFSPLPSKEPKPPPKSAGDMAPAVSPTSAHCSYAQATVKCGDEHVMLRSRIPDRNTAYAMDVDFPKMCTKLQPQPKTNKPNPPKAHAPPKPHISINIHSEQKLAAPKDTLALNKQGKSANELKQVRSIKSTLHVRSISKPQAPFSPAVIHQDVCMDKQSFRSAEVFGSRPLSACSSASVMAFDHADSEFSYVDSVELAEQMGADTTAKRQGTPAVGLKKMPKVVSPASAASSKMPPLTFTSPVTEPISEYSVSVPHSVSYYQVQHPVNDINGYEDISSDDAGEDLSDEGGGGLKRAMKDFADEFGEQRELLEVPMEEPDGASEHLTAASFKSERASTVPTDLGSQEPWMGIQYRYYRAPHEEEINLSEVMQLPGISKEEHVSQFLSTVPYDDTIPEPKLYKVPTPPPRKPNRVSNPVNTYIGRRVLRPAKGIWRSNVGSGNTAGTPGYVPPIRGEAIPISSPVMCTIEQPPADCVSYTTEGSVQGAETQVVPKELVVSVPTEDFTQESSGDNTSQDASTQGKDDAGATLAPDTGVHNEAMQSKEVVNQVHEYREQFLVTDEQSNYSTQVQPSTTSEPAPGHTLSVRTLNYHRLTDLSSPMTVRHPPAGTPPFPSDLRNTRQDAAVKQGSVSGGSSQGVSTEGVPVLKGVGLARMNRGRKARPVADRMVPHTQSAYATTHPAYSKTTPKDSTMMARGRPKAPVPVPRPPKPTKPISLDLVVKGDAPKLRYNHRQRTPVLENHRPCRKVGPPITVLPSVAHSTLVY